jgi:hypothetical protein
MSVKWKVAFIYLALNPELNHWRASFHWGIAASIPEFDFVLVEQHHNRFRVVDLSVLVLPQFGSGLKFEPEPFRTGLKFSSMALLN